MAAYLTRSDLDNYGSDLVDFAQRAALHSVAPALDQIQQQNAELRQRLAIEARRNLDQRVEAAVPNYREIDRDPHWHRFLLTVDPYTGRIRQELLNDAIAHSDAGRVVAFFRSFLRENQATDHTAVSGRARSAPASVRSDKPIYTREQIAKFYEQHRRGAYAGREAEWARQEVDFFRAQREGRVRGGTDVHGK